MTEIDPEALPAISHRWVRDQLPQQPLEALAADGQRLNGANRNSEDPFETVILVRHQDAIPITVRSCREAGGDAGFIGGCRYPGSDHYDRCASYQSLQKSG